MPLSETWFTEGSIDFELQKYRLLAYLQEVEACFKDAKLYPQLSDLIFHHNNLVAFRANKRILQDGFPRRIDEVNLRRAELLYEKLLADDALMAELEDIAAYAEGRMKPTLSKGTSLYDEVEEGLEISPVGINPPYGSEGYLLLQWGGSRETRAYSYTITLFEHEQARYKGLRMQYVASYPQGVGNTPESIKQSIIRERSALHSPAMYAIRTNLRLPLDETILPVARRSFMKYLATI